MAVNPQPVGCSTTGELANISHPLILENARFAPCNYVRSTEPACTNRCTGFCIDCGDVPCCRQRVRCGLGEAPSPGGSRPSSRPDGDDAQVSSPPSIPCPVKGMRLSGPLSTSSCRVIRRIIPATDHTKVPSPSAAGNRAVASQLGDGGEFLRLTIADRGRANGLRCQGEIGHSGLHRWLARFAQRPSGS